MAQRVDSIILDPLTADPSSPSDGELWCNSTDNKVRCQEGGVTKDLSVHSFSYRASGLLVPNSSDWTVNAAAGGDQDSNDASLPVRKYDSATEEGVGFLERSPIGSLKIKLTLDLRAETAPAAARTVGLKLYARQLGGTWANLVLNDLSIPTDETWQTFSQIITLAALSVSADKTILFEQTRIDPTAGTNLEGDLTLCHLSGEFV